MTLPPLTSAQITKTILLEISRRYPMQSVCWRQNVFAAKIGGDEVQPTEIDGQVFWRRYAGPRYVRAGIPGLSDIVGLIHGRFVAIEVKAGRDRLSKIQQRFRDAVIRAGGVHVVARDVDGAMRELGEKVAGEEKK